MPERVHAAIAAERVVHRLRVEAVVHQRFAARSEPERVRLPRRRPRTAAWCRWCNCTCRCRHRHRFPLRSGRGHSGSFRRKSVRSFEVLPGVLARSKVAGIVRGSADSFCPRSELGLSHHAAHLDTPAATSVPAAIAPALVGTRLERAPRNRPADRPARRGSVARAGIPGAGAFPDTAAGTSSARAPRCRPCC